MVGPTHSLATPLHLVRDLADTPAQLAFLRRLHSLEAGRVVCEISPGGRQTLFWLAHDVFAGLGKSEEVGGTPHDAHDLWRRLFPWLVGERVEHLLVGRAQLLDSRRIRRLVELAVCGNLELWLVFQGVSLSRKQRTALTDAPFQRLSFAEFEERWLPEEPAQPRRRRQRTPISFPRVPDADFTLFLATCRTCLEATEWPRVAAAFRRSRCDFDAWLSGTGSVERCDAAGYLREALLEARSYDEAIVVLRGCQVACLHHDLLVEADLDRYKWEQLYRPQADPDADTVAQIRAYRSTRSAAIALLAILTGSTGRALAKVKISDVDGDAGTVTVEAQTFDVPAAAIGIVRAHIVQRLCEGASSDDALFVYESRVRGALKRERPDMPAKAIDTLIRQIATETRLLPAPVRMPDTTSDPLSWATTNGIRIRHLKSTGGDERAS